jgi:hypothetical protein
MTPRCRKHEIAVRISGRLVGCIRIYGQHRLDRLSLGEHAVQLFNRDCQALGELGPAPWLRAGLATLPAPYRCRFDTHELGEAFLGMPHDLPTSRQSVALGSHGSRLLLVD